MNNNKGMTLIELIIALGLVSAVVLLSSSLLLYGNKNFHRQNDQNQVIANARYSMDYLTREVSKATDIKVEGNTLIVDSGSKIELRNKTLYKDNKKVCADLDNLILTLKNENELQIEIEILDKNSKPYKLSSIVYLR